MTERSVRIGIDLGGTKTEIVALDGNGHELLRRRVPTPSEDYAAILATIVSLVRETETALTCRGSPGDVRLNAASLNQPNTSKLVVRRSRYLTRDPRRLVQHQSKQPPRQTTANLYGARRRAARRLSRNSSGGISTACSL